MKSTIKLNARITNVLSEMNINCDNSLLGAYIHDGNNIKNTVEKRCGLQNANILDAYFCELAIAEYNL